MHCCIPTPTSDSNTSMGMIWVTLNMPSAAEECREPSENCQGISHCLESGHPVYGAQQIASYVVLLIYRWLSATYLSAHIPVNEQLRKSS